MQIVETTKSKLGNYGLTHYLFGALPARLGDEMAGQAILLVGLSVSHSAAVSATLFAALTLSAAPGGPVLGALLDRAPLPGKLLAGALSLYALGLGALALLLGHVPIWVSIGIALATGCFMPAVSGGWSSRLKSFIAAERMTRVSAIDATTFNIAGLAGPALAGLLAARFDAYWAVAVLVLLLVIALPMAWLLPKHTPTATPDSSFLQDVAAGFHVIIARKALLRITLTSVISYFGIGMLWVVCPLVGKHVFGNPGYGGVMLSVLSVSALLATLAYTKWPGRNSPDVVACITTVILALAMLILAFAGNGVMVVVAMLVAGVADGPQLAAIFAVRHREAPERVRSQVFTTGASLKITAAALGSVLAGQLASASLRTTILTICVVQVGAAAAFIAVSRTARQS